FESWCFPGAWILMLGSSLEVLLSIPEQNRDRDRTVTKENEYCHDVRTSVQDRSIGAVFPAKRLKHAADPVAQVQTKQRHTENVKARNPPVAEAQHHHFENVMALFAVRELDKILSGQVDGLHLDREMQ